VGKTSRITLGPTVQCGKEDAVPGGDYGVARSYVQLTGCLEVVAPSWKVGLWIGSLGCVPPRNVRRKQSARNEATAPKVRLEP